MMKKIGRYNLFNNLIFLSKWGKINGKAVNNLYLTGVENINRRLTRGFKLGLSRILLEVV